MTHHDLNHHPKDDMNLTTTPIRITSFIFDTLPVRAILRDGEPWFVAADIATALDYAEAKDMTRNLEDDEKGRQIVPTPGGNQEMTVINESGLFAAVLKSRKPEAQRFRRWVTGEVLPSIRKTGQYSTQPVPLNLADPAVLRSMLLGYTERVLALEATVAEQAPAVAAQALLAGADGAMCVTSAAKLLKQPPKKLFSWLSAHRWIYRRAGGKSWLGYQDKIKSGLVDHQPTTVQRPDGTEKVAEQLLITPKGLSRLSLHSQLTTT